MSFRVSFLVLTLFFQEVFARGDLNKKWTSFSSQEKKNIQNLFEILERSATGKKLLRQSRSKAKELNKTLFEVVSSGDVSLTDSSGKRKIGQINF